MFEYRKLIQFRFKNNVYNMYLDRNNKHFFLRVNKDNKLSYISMQELFELTEVFTKTPLIMNIKKGKKVRITPKVFLGSTIITLTLTMTTSCLSLHNSNKSIDYNLDYQKETSLDEEDLKEYVSFADELEETMSEDLVVDTYLESDLLNFLFIYDMDYLDKVLDYDSVTIDQLNGVIESNNSISPKFKKLISEFAVSLTTKYPDVDTRIFYENLKTIEVVECDKRELIKASLSIDSSGVYNRQENKIYVLKDYEYKPKTWDYQVLYHELAHCMRNAQWEIDGKKVKVQVEGQNFSNVITSEALNSLFSVSLFDYEERDIAYQLQSNYHQVMIECLDNYTLSDYGNKSISYYAKKLDEHNQDDNYSVVILELIQFQYNDFHRDSIETNQESYYPIYDYISKMYFSKNISSNSTYEEALDVADELVERILYDVPEEYNIDKNRFYENVDEYCKDLGITTSLSK